jgi:glycosyltransferase involved in cell wall biosynthesis
MPLVIDIITGIKMMSDKKILLISETDDFINMDYDILKKRYQAEKLIYTSKADRRKLIKLVPKYDINISWFILGYSYLAMKLSRVFRKKTVLIAGGWDVATLPEIGYGYTLSIKRKKRLKYLLSKANIVLAVSDDLKKRILEIEPRCNVQTLPLGFDTSRYNPSGKKTNLVLTVATRIDEEALKLKGLETFVKSAELMPDTDFMIIGKVDSESDSCVKFKNGAPGNVKFVDFMPQDELIGYYQRAGVYAQLSAQESFGSALAEAMLCECVPVVTDRGALPEVVGDTGFSVPYGDASKTVSAIEKALKSGKGKDARKRVKDRFDITIREKKLLEIIKEL